MKYFVNAPKKRRKSRKRRTAAQRRATAKMIAANKSRRRAAKRTTTRRRRTTRRIAPVAKRRRRRTTARRKSTATRRRRSTKAARRSPVTRLRRGRVYVTNPRRRKRRGYARNPSYVRQSIQILKDTGYVIGGSAVGGVASSFLPDLGHPIANAAKGVAVAIGVRMMAAKFLGADAARFAAAGAMQVPFKNLVIGILPPDQQVRARALLGDYGDLGAYSGAITDGGVVDELGSYTAEMIQS